ncbi:nucleotidyltransferase domain-containing protein [Devosia sp. SL43]|uniref:nucleotidyltransferase domain-containing protein n=1 Tax=Devosia sp. SL43 TaxID=2806348 RepID=UPI001F1BF706|nr:nucleotidyltransferase domain-containing protein [Devosia sp. SL43]UJW86742.1 nucleotidyltransferase domain-containing protein [Devosia sp. SL43]
MDQQQLIEAVKAPMDIEAVRGLFLAGSYGRGTADDWSDVDFIAVVSEGQERMVADQWRAVLQRITPIVFWNELPRGVIVLNAISEEWLRCDLTVATAKDFGRRAKNLVKPLIDRDGIYDGLPDTLPPKEPDAGTVQYLIHEFIRMLGLMPVGVGRGEYVTMVLGVGMMRGHLEALLMQDVTNPDPGGILHQSKLLPPEQMQLLASLPYPGPEREALIAANLAVAREFMPRARAMAKRLDIAWPEEFEAATRRRLASTLGEEVGRAW